MIKRIRALIPSSPDNILPFCPKCHNAIISIKGTYLDCNSILQVIFTCPQCSPIKNTTEPLLSLVNSSKPHLQADSLHPPSCLTHPSTPLTSYCLKCFKAVCLSCKQSLHSTHLIKSFEEYTLMTQKNKLTKAQMQYNEMSFNNKTHYSSFNNLITQTIDSLQKAKSDLNHAYHLNKRVNEQLMTLIDLIYSGFALAEKGVMQHIDLVSSLDNEIKRPFGLFQTNQSQLLEKQVRRYIDHLKSSFFIPLYNERRLEEFNKGHTTCLIQLSNNTLASGSPDGVISLWSMEEKNPKSSFKIHQKSITALLSYSKSMLSALLQRITISRCSI